MAGAGEVVVLDAQKPKLEAAQAAEIRAKMWQETVGNVGKNIMDIVTQYQDLTDKKQKNDLAAITTAGALSGGIDKLPQDTKNRLPGILGVSLPTDEKGDVQVTPDVATVIKRMTMKQIEEDPSLALVAGGLMDKRMDPLKMAGDIKLKEMDIANQREKDKAEAARTQAANSARVNAALIGRSGRIEAAQIGADAKVDKEAMPSPFVLDPKSNTVMSEPQYISTYPGQQLPTKLSVRDAKLLVDKQKADSAVEAHSAQIHANEARVRTLDFHLKTLMTNPDPNDLVAKQLKHLTDLAKLSAGTDALGGAQIQQIINEQMPEILRGMGYKDEDIAALTAMAGEGGWWSYLNNWMHTFGGTTAVDSGNSARQPEVAHIPGVSDAPLMKGDQGGGDTGGGKVISADEFDKQYFPKGK